MRGHPSTRQFSNQFLIGRWKSQRRKFLAWNPSHFLPKRRSWRASQPAIEKMKLHHAVRIRVRDRQYLSAYHDSGVEFLGNLALERSGVGFSFLALASGEFPVAFEMYAERTARHEKPSFVFNDRGGHDDSA